MAIKWGAWQNTSTNGMRIGYDVSRTAVGHNSSSVTFTVKIYTQNRYPFSDNQHIDYGSYLGSRTNYNNSSSGGSVLRATKRYTYSYSDYGTSRRLASSARVGGVWSGLTPSVTIYLQVPARPYGRPTTPTNFRIDSQNSNGRVVFRWNNRASANTGKPYTSQRIEYSYYHSSGSWTGWQFLATVSRSAQVYTYNSMYSNTRYQFRIRANNSAGSSAWTSAVATNTVPTAPSGARARVESSGDSISVTWTRNNRRTDSGIYHQVQRQTSSSGSWSTVANRLGSTATSWVDTSPNAGYNRYRVRALVDTSLITAYSSWSTAAAITTIVPPLAPTRLAMRPRVPDFTRDTTLSWEHRDGGDGADQSHYELEYSADDGDTWESTGAVQASAQSHVFDADTLENGQDYVFRVRTRGNTQEGYGPWSAVFEMQGWTTPTVSLEDDAPPETINTIPFMVEWAYNQDEDRSQLRAEVEVWTVTEDEDGNVERGTRVLAHNVQGDATEHEIDQLLDDGADYLIRVRATSSREQVSDWDEITVTIDLLPPARVDLRPQYDHETGVMVLEVEPREARLGVVMARNCVVNGSFENGLFGWTKSNTATAESTTAHIARMYSDVGGSVGGYHLQSTGTKKESAHNWYTIQESDSYINVTPGNWVGVAGLLANDNAIRPTESDIVVQFNTEGGGFTNSYIDRSNAAFYGGRRVHKIIQVPDGADEMRLVVWGWRNDGTTVSGYPRVWADAIMAVETGSEQEARDQIEHYWDGDNPPPNLEDYGKDAFVTWEGAPHASPSIIVVPSTEMLEGSDADIGPLESPVDKFSVQRSIDDGQWVTILEDVDVDGADYIISLMDLLPTISGTNAYRLIVHSISPSIGETPVAEITVGPKQNQGWAFLNYGSNMGNVLRAGNNLDVSESLQTTGDDKHMQGRRRPISLFGEHETRTLAVSGNLYHDELQAVPSSQSPLDSPPDDWRMAAREANTVCLRTPAGHRIYGRMDGLDLKQSNLNVSEISFSVVENDFKESESDGAGVEVEA